MSFKIALRVGLILIAVGIFTLFIPVITGLALFSRPIPIAFIGFALLSLGLAIVGYVLIRRPAEEWDWQKPKPGYFYYDLFKWLGYTDEQMKEDSLLFRWSPKYKKFSIRTFKMVGFVFVIVGTIWFLETLLYLLGFDIFGLGI